MSIEYEVEQCFVHVMYPGSFFPEESAYEVPDWNERPVVEKLRGERRKPYGFYFTTRGRVKGELDSKKIATSGMHFLGGKIFTIEEIEGRNDPKDRILISNMKGNKYERIIQTPLGNYQPFGPNDVYVEFE